MFKYLHKNFRRFAANFFWWNFFFDNFFTLKFRFPKKKFAEKISPLRHENFLTEVSSSLWFYILPQSKIFAASWSVVFSHFSYWQFHCVYIYISFDFINSAFTASHICLTAHISNLRENWKFQGKMSVFSQFLAKI